MTSTRQRPVRTLRMLGSSIATPGAAAWIGDFLNAAYFARPADQRDVDDLRLAHTILATRWAQRAPRRVGGHDLPAFHRAFGSARARNRWRLDRDALLTGATTLLGDWFANALDDRSRRAHGIVFATAEDCRSFEPKLRLAHGPVGPITPPSEPVQARIWGTYEPVLLTEPGRALDLLVTPARWPDFGSDLGTFTAVGRGGLMGQTFEIQLVVRPVSRLPVLTRGYVTCTELLRAGAQLDHRVAQLSQHVAAIPHGAQPHALIVLTSHRGHFLGRAMSHLLVFEQKRSWFVRDIGCWDPLPWHLDLGYDHDTQAAFWSPQPAASSMLAQLALVSAIQP